MKFVRASAKVTGALVELLPASETCQMLIADPNDVMGTPVVSTFVNVPGALTVGFWLARVPFPGKTCQVPGVVDVAEENPMIEPRVGVLPREVAVGIELRVFGNEKVVLIASVRIMLNGNRM